MTALLKLNFIQVFSKNFEYKYNWQLHRTVISKSCNETEQNEVTNEEGKSLSLLTNETEQNEVTNEEGKSLSLLTKCYCFSYLYFDS